MNGTMIRALVAGTAAAGILVATRALSLWPAGSESTNSGVRLSWSARPERVEVCRELSSAELQALPEHMRMRVTCEGTFARYLLTVRVDDRMLTRDTIRGGGFRHDRPIHVLRDLTVPSGMQRLRVSVERIDSTGPERHARDTVTSGALRDRAAREQEERHRRAAEAMPERLSLDTTLTFEPGRVRLVTYFNEMRRLGVGAQE